MRLTMILPALLLSAALQAAPKAQNHSTSKDTLLLVFWNVENFFSPGSPQSPKYWSSKRFYTKCDAISKTILLIAEQHGRVPDLIALAEVENREVLSELISTTLLRKLGYRIVHYESPDRRGIDCALLYRSSTLKLLSSAPKHILDSAGVIIPTRDILLAQFEKFAVLVNHHPSQIGGKSTRRQLAMARLRAIADSLSREESLPSLAVGDFNEQLWPQTGQGSLKYNGHWEKIDGHFVFPSKSHNISTREVIFSAPQLLTRDTKFGGLKPRRTFTGPRYTAGISDHLPIVIHFSPEDLSIAKPK